MAYFKYQDKSIFYKEYGQGEPLIFLHGNTASSKMSELLMPLYAENFRCIQIDFLGNGQPALVKKIGKTTYKVRIHFSTTSTETMSNKIKRMPELTPAEQLTVKIDRFTYDYDTALYHDNSQSMTENVSEIAEALKQRDTHDIAL